jgi:2-oxoacid:acceptor oxidoreductase gamma subunit (pyruvate/2-ketoisovalerate family)/2-oxoacid:acceptor oxidoreductase delta subunit (pyruvate/2-ketoisovalerate family)
VRIRERELIHHPDIVVVLDPLLSTEQSVADGIKKDGLVILNTSRYPEDVEVGGDFRVATVDATTIALETLKVPITNTAILGAFSSAVGFPKLESIEKAILHRFPGRIGKMNIAAARRSYELVSDVKPAPKVMVETERRDINVAGYGVLRDVSSWRIFTPKVDLAKCIRCKNCWLYCPETAFKWVDDKPEIEYNKCKGCGICVNECPTDAIEFVRVTV